MGLPSSKAVILAAARRVNLERGPGRATYSAIASEAGVSRVTVYKWFPTKEDLDVALQEHETARFVDALAQLVAGRSTRVEKLEAALRHLVTYIDDEPAWAKGVATDPAGPLDSLRGSLDAHRATIAALLGDALLAVPAVRKGTVTADDATDAILRLAYSHYLMPHPDPEVLLRTIRGLLGVPL